MFTIGNAVIITQNTGSSLVNWTGKTVFVGNTVGAAVRAAIVKNLKLVNNTSLKGLEILKRRNCQ